LRFEFNSMYFVPAITFSKVLGTKMGIRLVLLAIVGLAALYTIHLLAGDWMKIRKGAEAGECK